MNKGQLIEELKKINVEIDDIKLKQLEKFYELLIEWNQKLNLTAITEKNKVFLKHFYDSASIMKIINLDEFENLCDIGSGAGFPGIVLKILFPHLDVVLIDSLNKRIEFLNNVITCLSLTNIQAIHCRAEDFSRNNREKYDVVTARAVAPLNVLLEYSIPLLKEKRYFIAMKGNISQEIEDSKEALIQLNSTVAKIEEFILPIEGSKRTLIKIIKNKKTLPKYPRKYSDIKKRPL